MDTRLTFYCCLLTGLASLAWSACDILSSDFCARQHLIQRRVTVSGLRDTMHIGDTFFVEISMPWELRAIDGIKFQEVRDSALAPGEYINLREVARRYDPELGVVMSSGHAPLGPAGDRKHNLNNSGVLAGFEAGDIIPLTPNSLADETIGYVKADTLQPQFYGAFKVIFNKLGRYYVRFIAVYDNQGSAKEFTLATDGFTKKGCEENVLFVQKLEGYENNYDMISRAEDESEIKYLNRPFEREAGFYIIVL